ncbi:DNA polymerase III subunit gamma and tau [Microbacterium alcoholitolerans]|uniref:DNA polymerase III subunit gamma and tau n=1 Tax=unclassified Microbacterium TaxID=2609290 RepID=UPI003D169A02
MTTALYRRYRPETFGEMIGQSQVTDPLMTALRGDRVGHAYLFSGPRGCGKTTSARILARCLNCAEGPTDTPCGVCPSCVELSRAGGGSLDVVEIDAASHNGVDDARDLRERATFAPSRDRFKIFILDEAHMVTPQGFNALLKLVEEPPAHVKFIFATTEPEKVLGTIRSRTHHYPFRLVPPAAMLEYVEKLCAEEGVQVAEGVLALVVRAGGGSPRDTLSLLDQLIAGSEEGNVTYERAVALLGYTHAALLDEIVDALAADDAAAAFPAVDRVVQTGQDPRRFVDDLLERLRDLIVIAAVGDGASAVLRGIPADEMQRMQSQAAAFGSARLSRTADLVSLALDDMTGATSPRLHLELMVARVLAGALSDAASAAGAGAAVAPASVKPTPPAPAPKQASAPEPTASTESADSAPAAAPETAAPRTAGPEPVVAEAAAPEPDVAEAAAPEPTGPVTIERISGAWPAVLKRLESISRTSWLMATSIQPLAYDAESEVLTLGFSSPSDVTRFKGSTPGKGPSDHLRTAIEQELGVTVKYRPAPLPPGGGGGGAAAPSGPAPTGSAPARTAPSAGDDAPAAGWANPMSAPDPAAGTPSQSAPQQSVPPSSPPNGGPSNGGAEKGGSGGSRPSSAAVTEWAVAPIPTSAAPTAEVVTPAAAVETAARSATLVASPAAQQQFPVDEEPAEVEAAASAPRPPVDGTIDRMDAPPLPDEDVPPYDDHPPYDDEPPYDPMYDEPPAARPGRPSQASGPSTPVHAQSPALAQSSAPAQRPASAPQQSARAPQASASRVVDGVERRGEAVIRQVLGAKFLREEPYQPPTRFN